MKQVTSIKKQRKVAAAALRCGFLNPHKWKQGYHRKNGGNPVIEHRILEMQEDIWTFSRALRYRIEGLNFNRLNLHPPFFSRIAKSVIYKVTAVLFIRIMIMCMAETPDLVLGSGQE